MSHGPRILLVGAVSLSGVVAACGGGDDPQADATTSVPEPSTSSSSSTSTTDPPPETMIVEGGLTLTDNDIPIPFDVGDSCDGDDIGIGYGDITSSTPVVVRDIRENALERTELGPGEATSGTSCHFSFSIEFEEGSDNNDGFVVQLGRDGERGEAVRTWDDLDEPQVLDFSLGDDPREGRPPENDAFLECLEENDSMSDCTHLLD